MKPLLGMAVMALLVPLSAAAQTLSPEEQEVWDRVEQCWAAYQVDADQVASLDCFHEEYSFWWAGDVLPFAIDLVRQTNAEIEKNTVSKYDVRPAKVVVLGNVAIVHWGVRLWSENPDGSRTVSVERISMTLVKEEGVWRYLGGGGSPLGT